MFRRCQKQNYSLIESIVQNMQPNQNMSKLALLVEKTHGSNECLAQEKGLDVCSKHQEKKGDYFESEYPWVKYCESCALNLALCGKKIEKSLNSQQMLTKIKLCGTIQSISETIKMSQQGHEEYSFLSSQLQQSRQWFVSILGEIDTYISKITEIRNLLEQNLQQHVNKQIKQIFERQSLIVSKKIQLINEKSRIECGFVDLIGRQNDQETLAAIEKSKASMRQAEDLMPTQAFKLSLGQKISSVEALFEEKLAQIKHIELKSPLFQKSNLQPSQSLRMSSVFTRKVLDYRTSKTQCANDDDISYQQGKRLLTACQTIRHSGIVTPFQTIHETPLGELSQNRRNSRTALQLKARCRSKSGQKKMQVNVRDSIQNAVKRKLV